MLADARSQRLVENFAGQWLDLRKLADFPSQDPDFDADLRDAFRRETELLFADCCASAAACSSCIDADYTYLNERLAAHYGIDGRARQLHAARRAAAGQPAARVARPRQLPDDTSAPNRTSPVVRGQWIVQNLLGAAVPSPPPGAAADSAKEAADAAHLAGDTLRARLEMHRRNPTCAACHAIMDPLGLSLENFDLVGPLARAGGRPCDRRRDRR